MGRWISPDPLFLEDAELSTKMPREFNLYAYVQNNPVSNLDVDGMFTVSYDIEFTAGIGGAWRKGISYVRDDDGNVGILLHDGGGGYAGTGGSMEGNIQVTNADTIFELEGQTLSVGLSIGQLLVGGGEAIFGLDDVMGLELGAALGIPSPMVIELHGIVESNELIWSVNVRDEFESMIDSFREAFYEQFGSDGADLTEIDYVE